MFRKASLLPITAIGQYPGPFPYTYPYPFKICLNAIMHNLRNDIYQHISQPNFFIQFLCFPYHLHFQIIVTICSLSKLYKSQSPLLYYVTKIVPPKSKYVSCKPVFRYV